MSDIKHLLVINAPPEKVYRALTEQEGLTGWWTHQAVIKPEAGSIAEFRFGDRYHNQMKITELIPNLRVRWRCDLGEKEWINTVFVFDLEKDGQKTILRFTHGDWRRETDFFAFCNYQWGRYMNSLKLYCETGQGEPFTGS